MKASQCQFSRETLLVFLVTKHNYVSETTTLDLHKSSLSRAVSLQSPGRVQPFFLLPSAAALTSSRRSRRQWRCSWCLIMPFFPLNMIARRRRSMYVSHVELSLPHWIHGLYLPGSSERVQSEIICSSWQNTRIISSSFHLRSSEERKKIKFKARRSWLACWCLNSCIFHHRMPYAKLSVLNLLACRPFQQMDWWIF